MSETESQSSLATQWGQLVALALLAWFVAIVPGVLGGAVACQRATAEFRATYGVTPDLLGCAVPGAATWSLVGAVFFGFAVWWGSGRGFPRAGQRLGRSMLGVASASFSLPAVAFLVMGVQPGSEDRGWVLGAGVAYLGAVLSALAGARRGKALAPLASAAAVFVAVPTLLYPVHHAFGIAVATPIIAPGLGLALATVLTSPRSLAGSSSDLRRASPWR